MAALLVVEGEDVGHFVWLSGVVILLELGICCVLTVISNSQLNSFHGLQLSSFSVALSYLCLCAFNHASRQRPYKSNLTESYS